MSGGERVDPRRPLPVAAAMEAGVLTPGAAALAPATAVCLQLAHAVSGVAHAQVGRAFLHGANHFGTQVLFQVNLDFGVLADERTQVFGQKLNDG